MTNGIVVIVDNCRRQDAVRGLTATKWSSAGDKFGIIEVVATDSNLDLHCTIPISFGISYRAESSTGREFVFIEDCVLDEVRFIEIFELQFLDRALQFVPHCS